MFFQAFVSFLSICVTLSPLSRRDPVVAEAYSDNVFERLVSEYKIC